MGHVRLDEMYSIISAALSSFSMPCHRRMMRLLKPYAPTFRDDAARMTIYFHSNDFAMRLRSRVACTAPAAMHQAASTHCRRLTQRAGEDAAPLMFYFASSARCRTYSINAKPRASSLFPRQENDLPSRYRRLTAKSRRLIALLPKDVKYLSPRMKHSISRAGFAIVSADKCRMNTPSAIINRNI